jgi:serine/threonine-protein kinase
VGERGIISGVLPTATALGQYEIKQWIGAGGMGDVYEAVHTGLHRPVAIKTLQRKYLDDEKTVARFLREGQLSTRIRHANIVDVTDVGVIGGFPCLVMELLQGEPLSALLKREGPQPIERVVDWLVPVIDAVEAAHAHGVLHRDIKPSNIFMARAWNGEVVPKILDFGISKSVHDTGDASLTSDATFVGTPHYASPELMQGEKDLDGRSDQYSFGVVLYEAVTGHKPLETKGDNFVALALAACAGDFPPPRTFRPDLPPPFEAVILRAMALRKKERFTSMRALGEALLPFASERVRHIYAAGFAKPSERDAKAMEMTAATGIVAALQVRTGEMPVAQKPASQPSFSSAPQPFPQAPPSMTPPPGVGTLSVASGARPVQAQPVRSPPTALYAAIGLGIAVVVGGFVIGVESLKRGAASSTTSAQPSVNAPPPTSYTLSVTASPTDATFELDGVPSGTGSLVRVMPTDGRHHTLRAMAPGFETVLVEFDEAHPPPVTIALRPSAIPGPASASAARPIGKGPGPAPAGTHRSKTDNIDPWQ